MIVRLFTTLWGITNSPLCRGSRASAVARFAKFQLATRLTGSRLVVDWVGDAKFVWQKGEHGLSGNLYCGLAEYEDMAFLLHYLRLSDEFYDIGANVGAYTILASAVVGCKSYAHEPVPDTFSRLVDQVNINGIPNLVEQHNSGVGSSVGVLMFTNSQNDLNHVTSDEGVKNVTEVEVVTLDSMYDPQTTSLIKIDVEGYEDFVLDGGNSFFSNSNVKVVILELNGCGMRYGVTDDSIDRKIRKFGFKPIIYDPESRRISRVTQPNSSGNTIYVRDIDDVAKRCTNAERFDVHTVSGVSI